MNLKKKKVSINNLKNYKNNSITSAKKRPVLSLYSTFRMNTWQLVDILSLGLFKGNTKSLSSHERSSSFLSFIPGTVLLNIILTLNSSTERGKDQVLVIQVLTEGVPVLAVLQTCSCFTKDFSSVSRLTMVTWDFSRSLKLISTLSGTPLSSQ
ncbi:GSCOCG00005725001-RA-CDS [Cotesia congregata]|uniref:Uncharacterized protein n=1 Tax=Cotesia congregata TaxID=51543 RepID=A0A8J2MHJ7_COTCN|nr:GSCOCG00005725001-RA-CDS [Cotesia congregata]CAG5083538.1 Protein of unknown function [Cotesia congregata]